MKRSWWCRLGWHKWGERRVSLPYYRKQRRFVAKYVRCERPGCDAIKAAERRM